MMINLITYFVCVFIVALLSSFFADYVYFKILDFLIKDGDD